MAWEGADPATGVISFEGKPSYRRSAPLPPPQEVDGPKRPTVSQQFTVHVEAVMVDKNQTFEFIEYYDYLNNRGRLHQTQGGHVTDYYYDYNTNEMLIVRPDDYTCTVQPLSQSPYVFVMGDKNNHIYSPGAALRFGAAGSPETYLGKSSVRDILVNQWQSCMDWPDRNTTMTVTWSFVDNLVWLSSTSEVSVPIECHVTGRVYSDDQTTAVSNIATSSCISLDTVPPDSEGSPQGIVCPGRRNTLQLPILPDAMSFTTESISEQGKTIAYTDEKYDRLGNIASFTFHGITSFSPKYGTGTLAVVHDFNTGTEYVRDMERGNCSMEELSDTLDVATQSDLVTLRLKTSRDMLQLDGNYTFQGRTIRDMLCDVWVAEKHAKDMLGITINGTYEWAFLTFGARQTAVVNVYDFKASVPDISDDVNLDTCFIGMPRNTITFSIARVYKTLLEYFEAEFKYAVRHNIAQAISVSPLRIANIAYRVQQMSLDVAFDLLSVPNVHSRVVDPATELPLDQATQRLADAVRDNRLVIELNVNPDQPTFIVADPKSLRVLRLNQAAQTVVTGAGPPHFAIPTPRPGTTTPKPTATVASSSSSPPLDCSQYITETDDGYSVGVMVGSALAMGVVGGALGGLTHRIMMRLDAASSMAMFVLGCRQCQAKRWQRGCCDKRATICKTPGLELFAWCLERKAGLVLGLAHGQDVSESDGGFEFIYHEYHSLLLTIHNGTCYFTTIPDSAKGLMPGDRRKLIEGKAETVITSQDQSKLFPTSLHRMQATYHDVLADFHCLDKDVYQLQLFTPKTVTCNFESSFEPFCGFTQNTDDIFDWTRWSGSTPTNGTGPDADHTRGSHATDAGHYLYIETSEPRVQNDTARLTSQVYENPDGSTHCLRFSYNMHGQQMGGMNVYVTPSTNQSPQQTPTLVWNGTGDHGEQWKDVELEIAPSGDFQVIFEGVMGSYMSDIALDDISVSREPCNPPITCDFESWLDPACGFTQDTTDTFNWTMGRGPTDTAGTGPSVDHTYGTNGTILGHYMYIETSEPRMANDIARIVKTVNCTDGASQRCLHFYYHMHGLGIGTLNVYATNLTTTSQLPPPIWSRSGVQGNYWKEAQVTIPLNSDFQLVFEGSVGPDHTSFGDIAVDDVIISDGECQGTGKDT
ncbi:hypothetical protein BaRGS_00038362, partial [Batillaria attramentaria]